MASLLLLNQNIDKDKKEKPVGKPVGKPVSRSPDRKEDNQQTIVLQITRDGITRIINPKTMLSGTLDSFILKSGSTQWDPTGCSERSVFDGKLGYEPLQQNMNMNSYTIVVYSKNNTTTTHRVPNNVSKALFRIWQLPIASTQLFECHNFTRLFAWLAFGAKRQVIESPKEWCCRMFETDDNKVVHSAICVNVENDLWLSKMGYNCSYVVCSTAELQSMYNAKEYVDYEYSQPETHCAFCKMKNKTKTKRCSRCRGVYYCNSDCQIKDWALHKETCFDFFPNQEDKTDERLCQLSKELAMLCS